MPLLSSAKKAEQFAALLDGSSSGASGELASLGQLAARLSSVPQPRPEFASALRAQLMQQAATTLPPASGTGTAAPSPAVPAAPAASASSAGSAAGGSAAGGSAAGGTGTAAGGAAGSAASGLLGATLPVWIPFATGLLATAVAIGGVGLGASQSLPGQPLYGVKRQVESIQYDLAGGAVDKAQARLGFATARLDEIAALLDERAADSPLSADLQQRIRGLLSEWAGETNLGTTALLDQLAARQGDVAAIRDALVSFTAAQARGLAAVVQRIPDPALQSLTGSAFAYLQRVDTALGNPVQIAALLPSLGLALPTTTSPAPAPSGGSTTSAPGGSATTGTGTVSGTAGSSPSSVPTLPIPTNGTPVPRTGSSGTTPRLPSVPSLPATGAGGSGTGTGGLGGAVGGATGSGGGAVSGATGTVGSTVDGVLQGVTGNGPTLPLPTSLPSVPTLGR